MSNIVLLYVLVLCLNSFRHSYQSYDVSSDGRAYSYVVSSQQSVDDPSTSGAIYNSWNPQQYPSTETVKDPQSYSSNNYVVSSQQLVEDPSTSGAIYSSMNPQQYQSGSTGKDFQNYNTFTTNYSPNNDANSNFVSDFGSNSAQHYATNNSAYVTSGSQTSVNVNDGYRDSSAYDYGTDNYIHSYGNDHSAKTHQNNVVDYSSLRYGGYSGSNEQTGAYNLQNNADSYSSSNHQIDGNIQYKSAWDYHQPNKFIQNRFHPTTYEEDSHTGEVVQPPTSDSRPFSSQSLSPQNSDLFAMPSDSVAVLNPAPEKEQLTPPPLPNGYDYQPAPPPLPPPPPVQASPYYYYSPPKPPTNQYLPVPTSPPSPPHPPPPPPPPDSTTQERQVDYTYYYLGPKLWYVPLFFSIYFVLYVGALIIKAISKHKILFPQQLYNAATTVYTGRQTDTQTLDVLTAHVTRALANAAVKYLNHRIIHY